MKQGKAILLIITGLFLLLFSVTVSGALGSVNISRAVNAGVVVDEGESIGLDLQDFVSEQKNFAGLNNVFESVGSLANNTENSLSISVSVGLTQILKIQNNNTVWTVTVKAGEQSCVFTGVGFQVDSGVTNPALINMTVPAGENIDVQVKLNTNKPSQDFEPQISYSLYLDYGLYKMDLSYPVVQSYYYKNK